MLATVVGQSAKSGKRDRVGGDAVEMRRGETRTEKKSLVREHRPQQSLTVLGLHTVNAPQ
jgi:hypothetical protein